MFLSYSWSSVEHQNRILEWAERLVGDGLDVILDKWNLKEGQDKYAFMEKMVTDPEVVKVLVFSDRGYAEKADARKGGVGTESQIISAEVYKKVSQDKFLPIVCERDSVGEPFLPTFLKTRIYFDFSSPETFHDDYEKLVRAVFGKPLHKRPPLGRPPEYILAGGKPSRWSRPLLEDFKEAVAKDRSTQHGHAARFLETLAERMEEFRLDPKGEFDDQVIAGIDTFQPFRDDFVEFVDIVARFRNDRESYEHLADFFERCLPYKYRPSDATTWNDTCFDHFKFIIGELFLYTATLLMKHGRREEVRLLTDRLYLLPETAHSSGVRLAPFMTFCPCCKSLTIRNERLKTQRLDPLADLLHQRASIKAVPFNQIMQADALLFLMSILKGTTHSSWYPHTLIYASYTRTFEIFARAASKIEFKRLAALLGVANKEELLTRFDSGAKAYSVDRWVDLRFDSDVSFPRLFGFEQLDTIG